MNLQQKYDLEMAEKGGGDLKDIKSWKKPTKSKPVPRAGVGI